MVSQNQQEQNAKHLFYASFSKEGTVWRVKIKILFFYGTIVDIYKKLKFLFLEHIINYINSIINNYLIMTM